MQICMLGGKLYTCIHIQTQAHTHTHTYQRKYCCRERLTSHQSVLRTHTYMYVHTHTHTYPQKYALLTQDMPHVASWRLFANIYIYICVCVCVCVCVCEYMYILCICVYIYYVYTHMYIHTYARTHTHRRNMLLTVPLVASALLFAMHTSPQVLSMEHHPLPTQAKSNITNVLKRLFEVEGGAASLESAFGGDLHKGIMMLLEHVSYVRDFCVAIQMMLTCTLATHG
jgi:hypothetical protein